MIIMKVKNWKRLPSNMAADRQFHKNKEKNSAKYFFTKIYKMKHMDLTSKTICNRALRVTKFNIAKKMKINGLSKRIYLLLEKLLMKSRKKNLLGWKN